MYSPAGSLLSRKRSELARIAPTRSNWTEIVSWHTQTKPVIAKHFKEHLADFEKLAKPDWVAIPFVISGTGGGGNAESAGRYMKESNERVTAESAKRMLQFVDSLLDLDIIRDATPATAPLAPIGSRVFVVHGHNEAALQTVARFVERLGLPLTILREGPKRGRTVIEKFEEVAADVGFAVVLLTGDDRAGTKDAEPSAFQLRARQNVVLELGFFLGRIRRDKVCVLYEQGVEIPSDYSGVWFHELDSAGAWKMHFATELRAAGLEFDASKLLD